MLLIQKMVLTLLAIALVPVFLVAAIFYYYAWSSLQGRELNQISAIASIQKGRVENLIGQNMTRLTSYTSRAGLRSTLDQFNHQKGAAAAATQALLQTSVTSLKAGDNSLESVTLLSPAGAVVASTDTASVGRQYDRANYVENGLRHSDATSYIAKDQMGRLSLYSVGPLPGAGGLAGVAVLESDLKSLEAVAADYTGLGQTGEVMVVRRAEDGGAEDVLPLRFDMEAPLKLKLAKLDIRDPAIIALDKQEGSYAGLVDWRGQKVLAATRYIPSANWGLAVMIDQTEALAPLNQLSNLLLIGMFIVSVVIIFVAFFLARYLNEPILALAVAAEKIRGGDLSQRVKVTGGDEIGRLAATFNSMVENVEKVDQMKSEFVLLASHQLRTPATAVKGFISMMLDGYAGKLDPKHRALLNAAYEENERQISVINSILDVARLEAGEMVLARDMFDLGKLVEKSAAAQREALKAQKQTVTVKRPKGPVMAWVDAEKLQLVLDNLIHNASKYSDRGKHIQVVLKQQPETFTIEVKDEGIGIAQADIPRLFKRFSRISGPQTANIQGAGLGLYLADKLVKMHGGRIIVESEAGKGTNFRVEMPNNTKEDERGQSSNS